MVKAWGALKPSKKNSISYFVDYVVVFATCGLFTYLADIEPIYQRFSLNNYTLQYPHKDKDTINQYMAAGLSVLCPVLIMLTWCQVAALMRSKRSGGRAGWFGRGFSVFNRAFLGLGLSVAFTFAVTGALKYLIGKPRPDVIARCLPKPGSRDSQVFGLSSIEICTQTDKSILRDGFRSFPSGHASNAFAGLYYLALFLAGQLRVMDSRGFTAKWILVGAPIIGACMIAGTRIMDARHHPFDVLSGASLGLVAAWTSYRQFFPALSSHQISPHRYGYARYAEPEESKDVESGPPFNGDGVYERNEMEETAQHNVLPPGNNRYYLPAQDAADTHPTQQPGPGYQSSYGNPDFQGNPHPQQRAYNGHTSGQNAPAQPDHRTYP